MHFADRLIRKIKEKQTPLCVGLDPHLESIPAFLFEKYAARESDIFRIHALAVEEFLMRILDRIAPHVAVVKPQFAFFERLGFEGIKVLARICREASSLGLMVIGDAKRGDIGSTAGAYAEAYFKRNSDDRMLPSFLELDAMTINPYLGLDSVAPFLNDAHTTGVFVLVRTSNSAGSAIQMLSSGAESISEKIAGLVKEWGCNRKGETGYSDIGAVVGAPDRESARKLRAIMKGVLFLIPGYGFQGATAEDAVETLSADGAGGIINSSRNILFAYSREDYRKKFTEDRFDLAVEQACLAAKCELQTALEKKERG